MSVEVFWTLPASDDGRAGRDQHSVRGDFAARRSTRLDAVGFTDLRPGQFNYYDYLLQVARAAEVSGLRGAFIPWQPAGEDPWIVASALARQTRRLTLLPEIQIPFATPVYLAKMSVSFQRLAHQRLAWSFDLGREASVRRAHGDRLEGADWFARADEYLQAAKGVWTTRPYDFRGRFYDVEAGGFETPLSGLPLPLIYTSGDSNPALELAAKHADVHVLAPDAQLPARIARLREAAAQHGRQLKLGLRLRVLTRHTEQEAQRDAQGVEHDLIGSHTQVAGRLAEYAALGLEHFVVEAQPHLEEAYRFGQHLLPLLLSPSECKLAASA